MVGLSHLVELLPLLLARAFVAFSDGEAFSDAPPHYVSLSGVRSPSFTANQIDECGHAFMSYPLGERGVVLQQMENFHV